MRIAHKVRLPRNPQPVEVDEAYQREVDRSTDRLARDYARAQRRAEAAEARYQRAQTQQAKTQQVSGLRTEWLRRLDELREIEMLMTQSPAGAAHRGTEGWTKVPR